MQTNAVLGNYTVREGLDLLLAQTVLAADIDEGAAVIVVSRVMRPEEVVQLPPYLVDSDKLIWSYVRVGDMELISTCLDQVTRRLIEQVQRLQEALALVLAPEFLAHSDVATIYVLLNERNKTTLSLNLEEQLQQYAEQASATGGRSAYAWNVKVMRNYCFWDTDSHAIFFILDEIGFLRERIRLTEAYLRDRLEHRTPALPGWLIEGVMELNRTMTLEPYVNDAFSMEIKSRQLVPSGVAKFEPAQWVSDAETTQLKNGHIPPRFPTLAAMFSAPAPSPNSATRRLWQAQAALFVRWTLEGKNAPRREALWRLLRQADHGPITESHFRNIFGLSYAEAETELQSYLRKAVRRGFELHPTQLKEPYDYVLMPASEVEVSLVKGDLDRLKIRYVRTKFPILTEKYIEQARRTLRRAYDLGERDPRLFGLMGLCECDAGDDTAAQPWLEKAAARGVIRPRVYFELARIRYHARLGQSATSRLTEAELNDITEPLAIARTQAPPQLEVYKLLVELWSQHTTKLAQPQLDVLDEGLGYFPREAELVAAVARLYARQNRIREGMARVEHGMAMTDDAGSRLQLQQLLQELAAAEGQTEVLN